MGHSTRGRPYGSKDKEIWAETRLETGVQNQRIKKKKNKKKKLALLNLTTLKEPKRKESHISDQELNQWLSALVTQECRFWNRQVLQLHPYILSRPLVGPSQEPPANLISSRHQEALSYIKEMYSHPTSNPFTPPKLPQASNHPPIYESQQGFLPVTSVVSGIPNYRFFTSTPHALQPG